MEDDDTDQHEAGRKGQYWIWDFPEGHAGRIVEGSSAGPRFENICHHQQFAGKAPWDPFSSEEEWEIAQWLVETGVSQRSINEFLRLKKVNCAHTCSTFILINLHAVSRENGISDCKSVDKEN